MKKRNVIIAVVVLVTIAGIPVFAQNNQRGTNNTQARQVPQMQQGRTAQTRSAENNRFVNAGTVSSVQVNDGIFSATDSAGNIFEVKINPTTIIFDITERVAKRTSAPESDKTLSQSKTPENANRSVRGNNPQSRSSQGRSSQGRSPQNDRHASPKLPPQNIIDFTDIALGDWVQISYFGNPESLNVARIQVVKQ
ncbi:MAG: hypothetical protein R3Y36_03625 [Spirochaetales bacterium]